MLLFIFCLCFVQTFAVRFGFWIEDNVGKFRGCSVAQFGIISETATEEERYKAIEAINHLLRILWKIKYLESEDLGFQGKLKPIPNPSSNTDFLALSIEGEMNAFLAQIKMSVISQLDPPDFWSLVTFFKTPILFCPTAVAEKLLSEPETRIKLAKASIERADRLYDFISLAMIDLDMNFEVPRYISTGTLDDPLLSTTRSERKKFLKKKKFPGCCYACTLS